MKLFIIILLLVLAYGLLVSYAPTSTIAPTPTITPTPTSTVTPTVTPTPTIAPTPIVIVEVHPKATVCLIRLSLPDPQCTPGAIFPNVTASDVCVPGYTSGVRSVSKAVKDAVYRAYGVGQHDTGTYEIDHLIALELGGSNDVLNLWPEPKDPRPGYLEKDWVENVTHQRVCQNSLSLAEAQRVMATNWLELYHK